MIWKREQYLAHMQGQYTGREMFTELFGPLIGLEEEWKAQGATPEELDLSAFGWDSVEYAWIPANTGAITGIEPRVLEETSHPYSLCGPVRPQGEALQRQRHHSPAHRVSGGDHGGLAEDQALV